MDLSSHLIVNLCVAATTEEPNVLFTVSKLASLSMLTVDWRRTVFESRFVRGRGRGDINEGDIKERIDFCGEFYQRLTHKHGPCTAYICLGKLLCGHTVHAARLVGEAQEGENETQLNET